ncbi:Uu.00g094660.m01.CDS01 [Anthostomella pinea]|uniref:Uu.00g094660.m01.CDS01 n=1 Tax=Anthostomella pinea TaxID=933095 RepID=A0AAI8YKN5_9PEZI|nr:Uu.00g094660.m01.CDS01 [Anthostomella pinea]
MTSPATAYRNSFQIFMESTKLLPTPRSIATTIERHQPQMRNAAAPTVTEAPVPTGEETFKVDKKKKTIATAVGELPLSPVMDPSYWEATRRHEVPKARPGKPQNSVERQLRANPFAKALATPVRRCSATSARLPKFFLQDFNLIAHPETNNPWWVPRSLTPQQRHAAGDEEDKGIQDSIEGSEPSFAQEAAEATQSELKHDQGSGDESAVAATEREDEQAYGPSAYVLARRDLISSFLTDEAGFKHHNQRLFAGSSSRYAKFAFKAQWRQDMDSFMLLAMREDIVDDLLYLSRLCVEDSRYYIVKCHGWDDVQYKHKGAVLWFGEPGQSSGLDRNKSQPGPFATFDIKDVMAPTSVVVHNMPMLLGPDQAAKVKEEASVLRDGSFFMLAGRRTTELQLKLWRLQGYLADYRDTT